MSLKRQFAKLRGLFAGRKPVGDLEAGMPPDEAHYAALRRFGNITVAEEKSREMWGWNSLETFSQDVRYSLRQLRRNLGFTVAAVLTLALGIGANTAIFSMVNAVVLHPLPYPHGDRLIWITEFDPEFKLQTVNGADYFDWKKRSRTLDRIAACDASVSFNLTGRGVPARAHGAYVSASFFATLGLEPQLGRAFTEVEDRRGKVVVLKDSSGRVFTEVEGGGDRVAVLMHPFWQQYFGSDPHVLGQTVTLDAASYTVVGVMPASFRFPGDSEAQMLLPAGLAEAGGLGNTSQHMLGIIGRLKPGITLAVAQNELDTIRQHSERTGWRPTGIELTVIPLADHLVGNLRPAVLILLGVVGLVLLIACANVANLLLTRASARAREMAVRAALGASRWRLTRQLLAESATLALMGGVAGLLLAICGVNLMRRFIPASVGGGVLSVSQPHVDGAVLLFALAVSFSTGILFGLAPAAAAVRPDLVEGLKESTHVASVGRRRGLLHGTLAVAEISLALVLLTGAGLLIRSFYRLLSVNPGFVPEHVLTMDITLPPPRYPTDQQRNAIFSQLLRRVESLPGVRSAALGDSLPFSTYSDFVVIPRNRLTPSEGIPSSATILMPQYAVSPSYFYTLGIPLLRGRTFTDHDDERSSRVVVVNESLASLWPGKDPVGKPLELFGGTVTVVGVVGNIRHDGLNQAVESEIFMPYLQQNEFFMHLVVDTAVEPASTVSAIRAQMAAVDPEVPIYNVATLEDALSDSVAPQRVNMVLLAIFASIALALATVGIYGVMAFAVTQRTHEIGIRMALGAERRDVLGLVVRQGLRLTLMGLILGVAGAWALTRLLTGSLYGVRPSDPLTFVLVSLVLVAVSILASYIPARRATKVDPMVALRYE